MAIRPPDDAPRRARLLPLVALVGLLAAACSGGADDDASDDGVATLETAESSDEVALGSDGVALGTPSDSSDDASSEEGSSAEEAALAFAACMREAGIDFPDPTVDADGNPSFQGALRAGSDGGIDPGSEEFQAAIDQCQDLTDGFALGGGGGGFDPGELEDALLPYTECLREQGLDVGDFQFPAGGPGAGQGGQGDGQGGDGAGQGQGRGGDPGSRISQALGLDPDDPVVSDAIDTCQPVLDEAFTAFGPGAQDGDS